MYKKKIIFKNNIATYLQYRHKGYVTRWCGNGLICMYKKGDGKI